MYPIDCMKTRIQVASGVPASTVIMSLYRAHGMRVFFSGVGITLIRAFPVNAALFVGVESAKSMLPFGSAAESEPAFA